MKDGMVKNQVWSIFMCLVVLRMLWNLKWSDKKWMLKVGSHEPCSRPVFMARGHGLWTRVCFSHPCPRAVWTGHPCTPVNTARVAKKALSCNAFSQHGLWTGPWTGHLCTRPVLAVYRPNRKFLVFSAALQVTWRDVTASVYYIMFVYFVKIILLLLQ